MRILSLTITLLFIAFFALGQEYKSMMDDPRVNFYDVVEAAEAYYADKDKGKGSGWKGYQRWKYANEPLFYPDGDRMAALKVDVFESFKRLNPNQGLPHLTRFDNGWRELGPNSIDNITGHYSPGLGRVESYYVDPNNDQLLYLGSRSGGFWKSTDGGQNWTGGSTDFLPASGVNTIAVSPTNPDSILINIRNARNGLTHGIYRSIDGGATWTLTDVNPSNGFGGLGDYFVINSIYYHPRIPNLVYFGAHNGIWRSDDNLKTWTKITTGACDQIAFHPTQDHIIYAHNNYGPENNDNLWVSSDTGKSFSTAGSFPGNGDTRNVKLEVTPDCPDCIFAASAAGVWKSINQGTTFLALTNPDEGCDGFAVNDQDQDNLIYGYLDLHNSTDGGINWTETTAWAVNATSFQQSRYIHADLRMASCVNGVFYVATDGYLCKSDDGGVNWTRLSRGTSIRENYDCGVGQSNSYSTIAGSQDNGTSLYNDTAWLELYGADGMEGIIHPTNSDFMMGSVQYGTRIKSTNGGANISGATPPGQNQGYWEAPLQFDPQNQMTVYSFSDTIYRSDDFGASWRHFSYPGIGAVQRAVISLQNSNLWYIARNSVLRRTDDGGQTWVNIEAGLPGYSITDIAVSPKNENTVMVTYARYQDDDSKVYISHDKGNTWTNISHDLGALPVRCAKIDHSANEYIYIGTEIGVYYLPMGGNSWTAYNTMLPNVTVTDLEINFAANTLKAATWGRGLWEYVLVNRANYPAIDYVHMDLPASLTTPIENVANGIRAEIEYDGTLQEVYLMWSADTSDYDTRINFSAQGGGVYAADTGIPGLSAGRKIYYKVFAVGDNNDTSISYGFQYQLYPFQYCSASGTAGTGSDYIDYVELNGVNASTGKDGYIDNSHIIIPLDAGEQYTLRGDLRFAFDQDTIGAWIDYNNNSLFEQSERLIFGSFNANHEAYATFTVPITVASQDVRMRVRSQYFNSNPDPCGNRIGEVEDYTIRLSASPTVYTDTNATACDSFTWVDTTFYVSGSYVDTFKGIADNDSIVTLELTIFNSSTGVQNELACDSFNWKGSTYTSSGTYRFDTINQLGCDSILTLNLTINNSSSGDTAAQVCDSMQWYGQWYYNTGQYQHLLSNAAGCDSVLTLNLTIRETTFGDTTAVACDSMHWYGQSILTSGVYQHILNNAAGCDSVLRLSATIYQSTISDTAATACDSFIWYGNTYTTSGNYEQVLSTALGCDSTIRLHLNLLPSSTGDTVATQCHSFTWYDSTYYASGNYNHILRNATGCDSVVTLQLSILTAPNSDTFASTCDSIIWYGNSYKSTGIYERHIDIGSGCDSVVSLHLTVHEESTGDTAAIACDSFVWHGTTYHNSGDYTHQLTNHHGCDSIVTLQLELKQNLESDTFVIACDSFNWYGNTYLTSGIYQHHSTSSNGCDSTIRLNLSILPSTHGDTAAQACGHMMWYGQQLSSTGDYQHILNNSFGCDSIVTLSLTIIDSAIRDTAVSTCSYPFAYRGDTLLNDGQYDFVINNTGVCDSIVRLELRFQEASDTTLQLSVCDSLVYQDSTMYSTGNYQFKLINTDGCDSIVNIELTVLKEGVTEINAEACEAYTWYGNTYSTSGTYLHTTTSSAGCDSTLQLNLTIHPIDTSDTTAHACYFFDWYGQRYAQNGVYYHTLTQDNGCDSTIRLQLFIHEDGMGDTSAVACDRFTWYGNTYTQSGVYQTTIPTVHGCDSVLSLNLTINPFSYSDTSASACGAFTWYGTTYTESGTYTHNLTNIHGCDSVTTLELSIKDIDPNVTQDVNLLRADEAHGDRYQWLDCSNGMSEVPGATRRSLVDSSEGRYAVEIEKQGCIIVSDCYDMIVLSIGEANVFDVKVFPQPSGNVLRIEHNAHNELQYNIIDLQGAIVDQGLLASQSEIIDLSAVAAGSYILRLYDDEIDYRVRIVKE